MEKMATVTRYGYFLASEEHSPAELARQARLAEQAGFDGLWISDHIHPWLDEQGQSGFVWSVIGAISQATSLPVTTAVTCPDPQVHIQGIRAHADAAFDEVYIGQAGGEQDGFFEFYAEQVLPRLREGENR
jgi:hypothetical protein